MSDDLRAPIFTASWDLCVWILTKARAQPHDILARELAVEALRLLDTVTLALKNIDRASALEDADSDSPAPAFAAAARRRNVLVDRTPGALRADPGRRHRATARGLVKTPVAGLGKPGNTWQNTSMAGATSLEVGGARRVVRQPAREPALREPGQRPPREQEREPRVPVCARPPNMPLRATPCSVCRGHVSHIPACPFQ